jgi:lysozyme
LRIDEGVRKFPYVDTAGKLTIGVGHNLADKGLPDPIIDALLEWDIEDADSFAKHLLPDFDALSDVRKYVVCNMAFNLGTKLTGFSKFLLAVHEQRWEDASKEMLNSLWAQQVGDRALRLSIAMRDDTL